MFSYNEYKSIVEKVTNELPLSDSLSVYDGLDEFVFIPLASLPIILFPTVDD